MKNLKQTVFFGQPKEVDWCGVDYDGLLSFGTSINPRYTRASERWRGFTLIGKPAISEYKRLTSLRREKIKCNRCGIEILSDMGDKLCAECWAK